MKKKNYFFVLIFLYFIPLLVLANPVPAGITPGEIYEMEKREVFENLIRSIYGNIPILALGLVVEIAVSYLFLKMNKLKMIILVSVFFANIISFLLLLTLIFILVAILQLNESLISASIFLLELLVIIFEASFIYLINKRSVNYRSMLILSFFMNLASVLVGAIFSELPYLILKKLFS